MNTLIIIGIVIGGTLILGLGLFLFIRWKGKGNKVSFMLHTRDMRSASLIQGKANINEKGIQQYYFKNFQNRLPLRPPTRYLNNKPIRDITFDNKGDVTYIESFKMDEVNNIKLVLSHEEKLVTLNRLEEYNNRFSTGLNKFQAMTIIAVVILMIIGVLGAGYMGYNSYKVTKVINENSEDMLKIADSQGRTTQALKSVSEQLTSVTSMLVNNRNVTRQIS